jgi:hypothetical protein
VLSGDAMHSCSHRGNVHDIRCATLFHNKMCYFVSICITNTLVMISLIQTVVTILFITRQLQGYVAGIARVRLWGGGVIPLRPEERDLDEALHGPNPGATGTAEQAAQAVERRRRERCGSWPLRVFMVLDLAAQLASHDGVRPTRYGHEPPPSDSDVLTIRRFVFEWLGVYSFVTVLRLCTSLKAPRRQRLAPTPPTLVPPLL